jgi:hypothetical protein
MMVWRDLERSGPGLIEVLSLHLPEGTEKTHKKHRISGVLTKIRIENFPKMSLERFHSHTHSVIWLMFIINPPLETCALGTHGNAV